MSTFLEKSWNIWKSLEFEKTFFSSGKSLETNSQSFETISKSDFLSQGFFSTGFQVYCSKCWVLVCDFGLYNTSCFLFLVLACWFCHSLSLGRVPILPLLAMCSVYVRQGNMIQLVWEFYLFSVFFLYFWLIIWMDAVSGCGWCLAEGRGSRLPGDAHQIPSVSWIFHHFLHFHIN